MINQHLYEKVVLFVFDPGRAIPPATLKRYLLVCPKDSLKISLRKQGLEMKGSGFMPLPFLREYYFGA